MREHPSARIDEMTPQADKLTENDALRARATAAADELSLLVVSMEKARSSIDWDHNLSDSAKGLLDDQIRRAKAIVGLLRAEARAFEPDQAVIGQALGWKRFVAKKVGALVFALGLGAASGVGAGAGADVWDSIVEQSQAIVQQPESPEEQSVDPVVVAPDNPARVRFGGPTLTVSDQLHRAKPDPNLSVRLRSWRQARGLTQAELAEALGIHRRTISSWETESAVPTPRHSERLLNLMETTLTERVEE
jgi:DNA-binding XRE family transcriptional regulator